MKSLIQIGHKRYRSLVQPATAVQMVLAIHEEV